MIDKLLGAILGFGAASMFSKKGGNSFAKGREVEDLISKGIVELKILDTKPEHAKEYGLDSKKPLYVQAICVSENERLKGIGNKVLKYIDDYAIKNGHDVVFGHITQKAQFSKDNRQTFFCDIDLIKHWLHSKGYAINSDNNDFHKLIEKNSDIRFAQGGLIAPNGKPSNLTPEQYKLVRTPAFKKWFGDWENDPENASKVVDENGEPNMCFHATNNDFYVFDERYIGSANDRGFYGKGFYFTFQSEFKNIKYAVNEALYYGKKLLNCYIKAINPFDFSILSIYKGKKINYYGTESVVFLNNICTFFPQIADKIFIEKNTWNKFTQEYDVEKVPISILPNLVTKYSKDLKLIETNGEFDKKETMGYVKSEIVKYEYTDKDGKQVADQYVSYDDLGRVQSEISKEEKEIIFIERAIEKYEGIRIRLQPEGYMTRNSIITDAIKKNHDCILQTKYGDELVVFEPNQIKLADGTNTAFDVNSPDIRFSQGGISNSDENLDEQMNQMEGLYYENENVGNLVFYGENKESGRTFGVAERISPKYTALANYLKLGLYKKGYEHAFVSVAKSGTHYVKIDGVSGRQIRISDHIGRGGVFASDYEVLDIQDAKRFLAEMPSRKDYEIAIDNEKNKANTKYENEQQERQSFFEYIKTNDLHFVKMDRTYMTEQDLTKKFGKVTVLLTKSLGLKQGQEAYSHQFLVKKPNENRGYFDIPLEYVNFFQNENNTSND